MPDMDTLRRFAGVDPQSDPTILQMCIQAAQGWYRRAGVPDQDGDELYDFWLCNLAAWFYDNRGATGPDAEVPPFILHSVHQLRVPARKKDTSMEGADAP